MQMEADTQFVEFLRLAMSEKPKETCLTISDDVNNSTGD